jgi:exodeoxyribonuclease VII small subunit
MAARKNPDTSAEELGFEESLERLETIVEELEAGQLTLEQSLKHYEEGMRLSKRLTRRLDEAEKTIERLVETGGDDEAPEAAAGAARTPRRAGTTPMDLPLSGANDELPF